MLRVFIFGSPQKNAIKWAALTVAIFLIFSFSMAIYGWTLSQPVSTKAEEAVIITVVPGMNAREIGRSLYDKGLIRNLAIFQIASKIGRLDNSLKAGNYSLHSGMSVNEIIAIISEGRTTYQQFTIPEGYTVEQIAKLLNEKNIAKSEKFKELAVNYTPYPYMATSSLLKYKAEGFLFPDTYQVSAGVSEEQLLAMMLAQFDKSFTPDMRRRADDLGLSCHDIITMASLVEKEAMVEEEQPIIAAVFRNRLKQNIPLQSCATIQYILGYPKAELTIEDTKIPSPYNTYQNLGLPPGPIANPGKTAIEAVLQNKETDNLYFVADHKGRHHFSRSYEEHLLKIAQIESGKFDKEEEPQNEQPQIK